MIYTVGYGNRPVIDFLSLLKQYKIEVVCDVRSVPYSSRYPDYTRETLRESLHGIGTKYVFLGAELGARPLDPDLYENGRACYVAMANSLAFRRGVERVEAGLNKYSLALLCAEKDPLDCHRAILIAPALVAKGIIVNHIDAKGGLERHEQLESRLLSMFGLDQAPLFGSPSDAKPIEEAYRRRSYDLAYDVEAAHRERHAK